jgi:hypothetical protein
MQAAGVPVQVLFDDADRGAGSLPSVISIISMTGSSAAA